METPEELRVALKRSGWSLGEFATPSAHHVEGTRGDSSIRGEGPTPLVAWRRLALAANLIPPIDPLARRCRAH